MTKRVKPKATSVAPTTINSTTSTKPVDSVEVKSNIKGVGLPTTKAKKANSTTTGASKRTRSKKTPTVKVEVPELTQEDKDNQVLRDNVTIINHVVGYNQDWYKEPKQEPKPSLYDRFVGWLVRITYNFRGF